MSNKKVSICTVAVILIVLLRLAIGWHFLFEGLHKFNPRSNFSALGFLGQAKGPTADLYYMMLPDLDGTKRLVVTPKEEVEVFKYVELVPTAPGAAPKSTERSVDRLPTLAAYENAWKEFKTAFEAKYELSDSQQKEIDSIFGQYIAGLREYAAEIEAPVQKYVESLERFRQEKAAGTNDAPHQRQRIWDAEMGFRRESGVWIAELDKMGDGLQSAFGRILSPELAGSTKKIVTGPEKVIIPNPCVQSQMRLLDLSVTYGLTAIGLCMMLGFCNRLACLGAAAFLTNVCLSQFPWPTIYPPTPDMIGHFMIVSKDFVELIACLLLAALPAGRWGGLDFFLWNFGGRRIAKAYGCKCED
ncbi:MAG: hypothetical protein ACRC10_12685 [Thermoguttaceae bacterium]